MYNRYVKRTKKSRREANISGRMPCEICERKTFLHTHHIEGRDIPNADNPSNLVDICPTCHNETHMGYIVLEGWFTTTGGKELIWHTKEDDSMSGTDIIPYIIPTKKKTQL